MLPIIRAVVSWGWKRSGRLKLGTPISPSLCPSSYRGSRPSFPALRCPKSAHVLCFAGAWQAANPQRRSWRKDFPFIPAGSLLQKGQGIITGQQLVTHSFCQWKESLLPSAPLLPPGIATKTTTPRNKEVTQGCEVGILTYKSQERWERAASQTASASLACQEKQVKVFQGDREFWTSNFMYVY